MSQKQWHDLPTARRVRIVVMGTVQFALLFAALRDIRSRNPEEINGSKQLWTMLSFVNFIGPVMYFLIGRKSAETGIETA